MASQITNHKCPACTGPLRYDTSGRLVCDYCGSSFSVSEIEKLYAGKVESAEEAAQLAQEKEEKEKQEAEANGFDYGSEWGDEAKDLKVYNCPSCGAQLFCEQTTAATSCPYCGNNTVIPGQFAGERKPDFIIPFKYDKEAAKAALNNFYKGKKLLPKEFEDKNHIEEIKGVYIPFWLYDGTVYADATFNATRVNVARMGNEQITTTEYYDLHRAGKVNFEKIPADGSSKAPDPYMDAIEPFDYSQLVPFSTAYLPGFLADIYDVSAQEASDRALKRATNTALNIIQRDVSGYTTCSLKNQHATMANGYVNYAMMPVWILSTRWNGNNYIFAMNGQTGKMVGDLPVCPKKYFKWFAGIAFPLMAVLSYFLIWGSFL